MDYDDHYVSFEGGDKKKKKSQKNKYKDEINGK